MANLQFKVIGIDDITTDPTVRFVCATTDGTNLYVGSESTNSDCGVWKYQNNTWADITDNLKGIGLKSINSILYRKGLLYVGTGENSTDFFNEPVGKGKVFVNSGKKWKDTLLSDSDPSVPNAYQILIRNLITVKDDLFAAGAMYKIFKYTNNSWVSLKPGATYAFGGGLDPATYSWTCFETDGEYLYAAAASQFKFDYSGVIQYDITTSSFESISTAGFGDASKNVLITNLRWYNSELYAATHNDSEGTQIWKYLGTPGSWSKVNTDGFGSRNNVNTVSLKIVDGNLVAATENKFGAEVWAYNSIDGWVKQTINSDVVYYSYMIQTVGSKTYLIGRESLKLIPSVSATEYLSYHEKAFKNANYWPQGPIGTIPIGLDKYRFIGANNKRTLVSEGTLSDPLNDVSLSPIASGFALASALPYPQNINVNLTTTSLTVPSDGQDLPGAIIDKFNIDLEESDPFVQFPEFIPKFITTDPSKFEQLTQRPLPPTYTGKYLNYEPYFNALHMSLIPKGPHRGKVVVMDKQPVVGFVSSIHPTQAWSFQPWAIIDPSEDAGTPEKPRCLNYLLPMGPSSLFVGPIYAEPFFGAPIPADDYTWPNLFCAGHTWSPSGDWIVAGGSKWGYEYTPDGISWADNPTFAWNPAAPSGSWFLSSSYSAITTQGHYVSAGSWTKGPNLQLARWYPTVMTYPQVSRTSNHSHALVLGGESTRNQYPQIEYDTYESLILSSICTSSNPGFGIDSYGGSPLFDGPSNRSSNDLYSGISVLNNQPYSSTVWNDSLYFYPRTFILSGGEITFAGMTHRSSYLGSHDTAPGVWNASLGNATGVGVFNKIRFYGSAYRIPNVSSHSDRIVRCGGEDTSREPQYFDPNTVLTDILDASSLTAQWKAGPTMIDERIDFNTVILPDATVVAIGGFRVVDENITARLDEATVTYNPILSVTKLGDHHGFEGFITLSSVSDTDKVDHYIEHLVEPEEGPFHTPGEKDDLFYEITPQESDPANIVGTRQYHNYSEVIDYNVNNPFWTRYDWFSLNSWRDYHSTAMLLPDGRVIIGGGEVRHTKANQSLASRNGIGYDFEILYPRYLRPTQNPLDTFPRPTGVGLSGATFNTNPEVDCFDLSHGIEYVLSSNFIRGDVSLEKVVFMAPGSVTHHACYHQRYHEVLVTKLSDTQLRFTVPSGKYILPVGFYMVFAITNQKVPAKAIWVRVV